MLMMANVDHVAGEAVPSVIERLLEAGARNAHVVQAMTKKGRWELLFFVDLPEDKIEPVSDFLVRELGTLGLRVFETQHIKFEYQVIQVQLQAGANEPSGHRGRWPVRVKLIYARQGGVAAAKAEYEDLRTALGALGQIGLHVSFAALKDLVESAAMEGKCQIRGDLTAEQLFPEQTISPSVDP